VHVVEAELRVDVKVEHPLPMSSAAHVCAVHVRRDAATRPTDGKLSFLRFLGDFEMEQAFWAPLSKLVLHTSAVHEGGFPVHFSRPPDQRASFRVLSPRDERSVARALLLEALLQRRIPFQNARVTEPKCAAQS